MALKIDTKVEGLHLLELFAGAHPEGGASHALPVEDPWIDVGIPVAGQLISLARIGTLLPRIASLLMQ